MPALPVVPRHGVFEEVRFTRNTKFEGLGKQTLTLCNFAVSPDRQSSVPHLAKISTDLPIRNIVSNLTSITSKLILKIDHRGPFLEYQGSGLLFREEGFGADA